jgi:hypothetical protein
LQRLRRRFRKGCDLAEHSFVNAVDPSQFVELLP